MAKHGFLWFAPRLIEQFLLLGHQHDVVLLFVCPFKALMQETATEFVRAGLPLVGLLRFDESDPLPRNVLAAESFFKELVGREKSLKRLDCMADPLRKRLNAVLVASPEAVHQHSTLLAGYLDLFTHLGIDEVPNSICLTF